MFEYNEWMQLAHEPDCIKETLIYSVWRRCFSFFETVEDGRVDSARPGPRPLAPALRAVPNSAFLQNGHSCFKKSSRLAKRNNYAFPKCHLISASLRMHRMEARCILLFTGNCLAKARPITIALLLCPFSHTAVNARCAT